MVNIMTMRAIDIMNQHGYAYKPFRVEYIRFENREWFIDEEIVQPTYALVPITSLVGTWINARTIEVNFCKNLWAHYSPKEHMYFSRLFSYYPVANFWEVTSNKHLQSCI